VGLGVRTDEGEKGEDEGGRMKRKTIWIKYITGKS
jgi:hypothetical protein